MPITRSTFASPISESELFVKLGEIHAVEGRDAVQSAYVTEIYWPEEFSVLKDRFANLDELNYLGKCMEGLDTPRIRPIHRGAQPEKAILDAF